MKVAREVIDPGVLESGLSAGLFLGRLAGRAGLWAWDPNEELFGFTWDLQKTRRFSQVAGGADKNKPQLD